jgi:peptide/nickel transport system permease protein
MNDLNSRFIRYGTLLFGFFLILCFLAPIFTHLDPNALDLDNIMAPPGLRHILGTDELGRDIFSRLLYGGRISLTVGCIAVVIAILLGTVIGAVAGFFGGRPDFLIMRFVDFVLALPIIFLILAIQVLLKPNIINVMIVIGFSSWMGVARLVRAEFLKIKNFTYIKAARAYGLTRRNIIFRKILPNALGPLVVAATLGMAGAVITESILSYLGLGVQPPFASWGNMLQNSQEYMLDAPWLVFAPGTCIFLTVLSLNFVGEGLRNKWERG